MNKKLAHKQIGVFGSAFNPPHNGHLDVIRQMDGLYEKILLIPSYQHAFNKVMQPFNIRCQMTEALISSESFVSDVKVLDIEERIALNFNLDSDESRPVYTWDLLLAIAKVYDTDSIDFILGPDNADLSRWQRFYRADDISNRWGLAVAKERVAVRSSLLREYIYNKKSVPTDWLQPPVAKLIEQHSLYAGETR